MIRSRNKYHGSWRTLNVVCPDGAALLEVLLGRLLVNRLPFAFLDLLVVSQFSKIGPFSDTMSIPPIQADVPVLDRADKEGKFRDSDLKTAQTTYSNDQSGSDDEGYDNKNPFIDPDVAAHWRDVYEKSTYECRHLFDPNLTWTAEEEKRIVRKLDWRVCLWAVSNQYFRHYWKDSILITESNSVSCSLASKSIVATLYKPCRIISWLI